MRSNNNEYLKALCFGEGWVRLLLVNKEQPAGSYEERFTINDEPLTSGVYFYQLKAGDYINTRKMLLLK